MRAVVTGGAGFIGSHLVDAVLERGWSVVVVDDFSSGLTENVTRYADEPRFEFIEADICGDWTVDGPVDLVLNFASPPRRRGSWSVRSRRWRSARRA